MENQKPNAIIRIHRPNITPEERERRLGEIRKAAARVILAAERIRCNT